MKCWVSGKSKDLTGTKSPFIVNTDIVEEGKFMCKMAHFLLSQEARDLEDIESVEVVHLGSHGICMKDGLTVLNILLYLDLCVELALT